MRPEEKRYLFQTDIRKILGVSAAVAKQIFDKAYAIDEKELGDCLFYERKVRASSVKRVTKEKW